MILSVEFVALLAFPLMSTKNQICIIASAELAVHAVI